MIRGEGRDALILEDISRSIWGRDSSLHPALRPEWAESHHISEARAALHLLGNRLRRYKMTQSNDSREKCMNDPGDIKTEKKPRALLYMQDFARNDHPVWLKAQ